MLKAWVSQVRRHLKHRKDVKEAIKATKRIADDIAAREKAVTDKYEKQALHSEYFDEHDQIWGPIEAYQSDRLVERARKMEIDVPRQPNSYEDDENWDWIPYGGWCLTDAAKKKIKNEIKEIRRQEYEEFRKWTTLMVAGASIFISLLALLWKTKAPDPVRRTTTAVTPANACLRSSLRRLHHQHPRQRSLYPAQNHLQRNLRRPDSRSERATPDRSFLANLNCC